MKKIKVQGFSFHSEPFWMWMSLVPAAVGIMMALLVVLVRKLVL